MTTTHKSRLSVVNAWRHSKSNGVSTPVDDYKYELTIDFANGTGSNQAQDMYVVSGTLLANTEIAIDVAGGITDAFGDTLTFATIKELMLVNNATVGTDDLYLGANPVPTGGSLWAALFNGDTSSTLRVKGGGFVIVCAPLTGYTVTGGSADNLLISNIGTNAVSYDLIIKGTR